jgi:hypothetical protein
MIDLSLWRSTPSSSSRRRREASALSSVRLFFASFSHVVDSDRIITSISTNADALSLTFFWGFFSYPIRPDDPPKGVFG